MFNAILIDLLLTWEYVNFCYYNNFQQYPRKSPTAAYTFLPWTLYSVYIKVIILLIIIHSPKHAGINGKFKNMMQS